MNSDYIACKRSRYIEDFRRFMKYFKREQIHVVDGDALVENPLPQLRKIERFLGLEHPFNDNDIYFDERKRFYCVRKEGQGVCLGREKGRPHPKVDDKVVKKLKEYFKPFNQEFYEAVGHNFKW